MVKQLLTLLPAIAFTSLASSADSSFDLMEYIPPAFNYHHLDLRPDLYLQGSMTTRNNTYEQNYLQDTVMITENSEEASSTPRFGFSADYGYYGWKDRTEWEIGGQLSSSGNLHNSLYEQSSQSTYASQSQTTNTQRNGYASGGFSVSAAHYFKWPFFIGAKIGPTATGGAARYVYRGKSLRNYDLSVDTSLYNFGESTSERTNYSVGFNSNIRFGTGHIDDVSFAVAALDMVKYVADHETSYKGSSSGQIQKLAALIEQRRKRRIFDSRIGYIENIDTICTYFKNTGIVSELSPRTVLEITDLWNYTFHQERKKGAFAMIYPEVTYSRLFDQNSDHQSSTSHTIALPYVLKNGMQNDFDTITPWVNEYTSMNRGSLLEYRLKLQIRYEKPLTRLFQLSLHSENSSGISRHNRKSWLNISNRNQDALSEVYEEYRYALPQINSVESIGLAYYPNTRTTIRISDYIVYQRDFDCFDIHQTKKGEPVVTPASNYDFRYLSFAFSGNIQYYFSPRLLLNTYFNLQWTDNYYNSFGRIPVENQYNYHPNPRLFSSNSTRGFDYSLHADFTWMLF